jgi:DNA-directed RNA polymerase specialized sigma24 family protein
VDLRSGAGQWGASGAVEPSAEGRVLEKERSTQLHAALERLKEMGRSYQVVILNGLEEMPMREVVAALGIPDGTARGRMLRGKYLLRQTLEQWDEEERKLPAA